MKESLHLAEYFLRKKLWGNALITLASDNNPESVFYKSLATAKTTSVNGAIRELEAIRTRRGYEYPVTEALIHWHNSVKLKDHESLSELDHQRSMLKTRVGTPGLILAAKFYWFLGDTAKARSQVKELVKSLPEDDPDYAEARALQGWIELSLPPRTRRDKDLRAKSIQHFKAADSSIDALMGKAEFYAIHRKFDRSLAAFNQIVVSHPWYLPAMNEKVKLLMLMGDWDHCLETSEQILEASPQNVGAHLSKAMYQVCRESIPEEASARISALMSVLDKCEPDNGDEYIRAAKALARAAGPNQTVIRATLKLAERACKLQPENSAYASECGYQLSLLRRFKRAASSYEEAARLDESNVGALYGQIYCLIQQGELEDASAQLEFLSVVQESIGKTADVTFLGAMLASRKDNDAVKASLLLDETVELHVRAIKDSNFRDIYDYFVAFNPEYFLRIAREYLSQCGTEPLDAADAPMSQLKRGTKLLRKVCSQVPGLLDAHLDLGRAHYIAGDFEAAQKTLRRCLDLDKKHGEAHLLLAQIALHGENFRAAHASLEQAVSHDFAIRNFPLYRLLKSKVLTARGDLDEALSVLKEAIELPGVRSRGKKKNKFSTSSSEKPVSLHDRCSIFVDLASAHIRLKQTRDGLAVLKDASREFKGTSVEVRLVIAKSELALDNGNVKMALRLLGQVPQDSPAYMKAHQAKAGIYLNHRNDKAAYAQCYRDLVEKNPSVHTHILLGDAYKRINMPDEAIEAYEQALGLNPKDSKLARRIGKAMLSTHDYARAIEYYRSALGTAIDGHGKSELRHDLANLYYKLKNFHSAAEELEASISNANDDDVKTLVLLVRDHKLLAKVHAGAGNLDDAASELQRALDLQARVVSSMRTADPEAVREQRLIIADICCLLARHFDEAEKKPEKAIAMYKEALKNDEGNVASMLALARFHLRRGELEKCQHQCMTLMRVDESNEEATMMLADLMFHKNEYDRATLHYRQLLEKKPDNFPALAKLIRLLRNAGCLGDAERFLQRAEAHSPRAAHDPGYYFCKGLFCRFGSKVTDAIKYFNKARRSASWGVKSLRNMIEIYINPGNTNIWEEGKDSSVASQLSSSEAIDTAKQLLAELPDQSNRDNQVLSCYAMMCTKQRSSVEKACQRLVEIVSEESDFVPGLLALSTALMIIKQIPKARNQLKRISKMPYNSEQADAFEKSWLLLADIFIQSGKFDLAEDLCKRCLQYNKSCAKAWEYMGLVNEKENRSAEAAEHYEQAWKFAQKSSAVIGYKLAFNYLKSSRYVDAIDVASTVVKKFPDYPKIKKDIVDKARSLIRG